MTTISLSRLRNRVETLARFGGLPGGGVTRPAWSPPYEEARRWLIDEMRVAGLTTWVDPAGNTFGALGADAFRADHPVVLTGSHIDTVPEGGILDGALGVLAGLECLHTIAECSLARGRPLVVAAWVDEEGRYGSLFGSRAFCGLLDPARLPEMAAVDGERLMDAMARAGFDAAAGSARRGAARGGGRVRRAAHRAGAAPRGSQYPHRRGRVHRWRAADPSRLQRPGRPRGHHADGAPPGRIPRRRGVRHEGPRPDRHARRRPQRHERGGGARPPRGDERRPGPLRAGARDAVARCGSPREALPRVWRAGAAGQQAPPGDRRDHPAVSHLPRPLRARGCRTPSS